MMAVDEENIDPEVERYSSMPIDEVNAELHQHGIQADETVKAVIALVEEKLHRRSVHAKETFVIICVLLAVINGIRRTVNERARLWEIGRAAPIRILS